MLMVIIIQIIFFSDFFLIKIYYTVELQWYFWVKAPEKKAGWECVAEIFPSGTCRFDISLLDTFGHFWSTVSTTVFLVLTWYNFLKIFQCITIKVSHQDTKILTYFFLSTHLFLKNFIHSLLIWTHYLWIRLMLSFFQKFRHCKCISFKGLCFGDVSIGPEGLGYVNCEILLVLRDNKSETIS